MKLDKKMLKPFCRKLVCIISILSVSIGFALGGALANSCQGGADCLKCAEVTHRHLPGAVAGMGDSDCRNAGQNSRCSFETSQIPDEFKGIISSDRSYYQAHTGIFATASDEYCKTHLPDEFVEQFSLSNSGDTTTIYLLNQALLC